VSYVPDWVYELVEAFVGFMDRITLVDALTFTVAGTITLPLVVLIHEAGHALAALVLRRRVAELTVGDDTPVVTVRIGGFRLRLGAITGKGDAAGFIVYDGAVAGPRDTFAIALAGPLASLVGALVTCVLTAWAWPQAGLSWLFGLATLGGLICCVGNLRVSGDDPASWSDGVWVRAAWRVMRRPTPVESVAPWSDPREATSIAPPHA
jgi:Zn-dependent protease